MPNSRLRLKSPDHALAIGAYLGMGVIGGLFAVTPAVTRGLAQLLHGEAGVSVWGLILILACLVCTLSALAAPHVDRPGRYLTGEAVGAAIAGGLLLLYAYSTTTLPNSAPITLTVFTVIGLALISRTLQVAWELHKLRRAQRQAVVAHREAQAQPKSRE